MDFETYLSQLLEFEEEISRYFDAKDQIVIFEVGACEGEDTIKLRRKFPNSNIYAFEPVAKNIERMRKNYQKYNAQGIKIFEMALSDKNGHAKFYVSSGHPDNLPKTSNWDYGNKSSSLLPPNKHKKIHKWVKFSQQPKIKTQRIDSFCLEQSIDKIDFIYLDVQGAELKVLEGAGDLLNSCRMIWLEVEAIELYTSQPLRDEVELFMKDHGFSCIKSTVGEVSGDQLYVKEKI